MEDTRIDKLEASVEKILERLGVLERNDAVMLATMSTFATKTDLAQLESTMLKWFIGTAITLTGLVFAIVKFIG